MTSTSERSPTLTLLHSAFGPRSTLYTVLQCTSSSTPSELKRAYRKAALRYHPDRSIACCCDDDDEAHPQQQQQHDGDGAGGGGGGGGASSSTLKFQAVSASYQILTDERRRSVYDRTGRILEEEEDYFDHQGNYDDDGNDNDDDGSATNNRADPFFSTGTHRKAKGTHSRGNRSNNNYRWEKFFRSVFNEIISTGVHHAETAVAYRGSQREKKDVLRYYEMCKGDMTKVVECVIHGSAEDVVRWKKEIVDVAVKRGELVGDYCDYDDGHGGYGYGKNEKKRKDDDDDGANSKERNAKRPRRRIVLEDESSSSSSSSSSDEEVITNANRSREVEKRRKSTTTTRSNSLLVDTDDDDGEQQDEEISSSPSRRKSNRSTSSTAAAAVVGGGGSSSGNSSMSKRDKMDFRVAKKRKAKAAKEMELSNIIQSKNWDMAAAAARPKKKKNMGGISDSLLSNMEKRYGNQQYKRRKTR